MLRDGASKEVQAKGEAGSEGCYYAEYCEMHPVSVGGRGRGTSQPASQPAGGHRAVLKSICIASILNLKFNATLRP